MNRRFPITISQEQVALFMEKYKPLADLGLLLIGVKTLQKIAPDLTEAILVSLATATGSSNQKSTGRANKLPEDTHTEPMTLPKPQSASPTVDVQLVESQKWLGVIPHPSVVVILGRRGSGKTALGHRLLELSRFRSLPYVLGMSQQAIKDLPEWLGVINTPDEAPMGATILVDEAQLMFNTRDSQKQKNREIGDIIYLSRQNQQTLIFISQQARTLDKNIASTPDVVIVKEPEPLQVKFERREINEIIKLATEKFNTIKMDRMKWSLVYSPACNFFSMLTNELPSYWSDKLSKAYAFAGPTAGQKTARKMSKAEKISRAKMLNKMGVSPSQIKIEIGVRSRTTVYKYIAMPENNI